MNRILKLLAAAVLVAAVAESGHPTHPVEAADAPKKSPQPSPFASVTQRIGVNDVTVVYHRPGVKGRKVWGELVPYDQVWRAGANEATTISFSEDVTVEGRSLPAGTYSFFAIPGKQEWSLVFNKEAKQWGAFTYKEAQDALRVKVTPKAAPAEEWLSYRFRDLTLNSAIVVLAWEKLEIPFVLRNRVEVKAK